MGYLLKETIRGLKRSRGTAALCISTISLSLLIFGLFLYTAVNVRKAVQLLKEKVEIEIYLEDSITTEDVETLLTKIRGLEGTSEAVHFSKEDALREAQLDSAFLRAVGTNPLPASIRVRLRKEYRSSEGIARVLGRIENEPGIEEIAAGKLWTKQLDRFALITFLATGAVGIIFGLASILVISNTVQLTVFSRRETIEIMQLIGAKESFIRGPFIIEGIFQGVAGGLLAALGLTALHWAAQQKLVRLLPLEPNLILALILLGGLIGAFGSNFSVGRFLKAQPAR
jgi:cell division transport system permease protein